MLGVAKALKAMHQYRVKGGPGGGRSQGRARAVRAEAAEADEEAAEEHAAQKRAAKRRQRDEEDVEQEPLMEGEVTRSQEGVGEGEVRAYAHRDIKPGMFLFHRNWIMIQIHFSNEYVSCRQHNDRR